MGGFDFAKVKREGRPNYSKSIVKVTSWERGHTIRHAGKRIVTEEEQNMTRMHTINLIASYLNAERYIHEKSNQNLLIIGVAGQGKSKLMRLMLEMLPNPKTIFSFKERDEYLQIEGNMIYADQSLPNPFSDADAFTSAFAVACGLSSEGIQSNMAISLVRRLALESSSWKEFNQKAKQMEKSKDNNTRAAIAYVLQKTANFVGTPNQIELNLDETNVLDFSGLDQEAKTFYAELFLRQIYKQVKNRRHGSDKLIVCIDEAHRLTKNINARYSSIFGEMSREVRAFGMLWTATQNLTDLPDSVRNQFATQFCFNTTSEDDMRALSSINRDLARCTSSLREHEFIDAKSRQVHDKICVYMADVSILKTRSLEERKNNESVAKARIRQEGRPASMIYMAILAIHRNKSAKIGVLARYLKDKGLVTSPTTLYGNRASIGIFENAVKLGYATNKDSYELTREGLKWIDAITLIERGKNLGSELHRQLMKKTIEYLQDQGMLVIVPEEADAPDMIAYSVDKKKKYLWDDRNRRAYEIQTTARKENVLANMERDRKLGLPITWVNYDKTILEGIKSLTENKDEYLLIKM